MPPHRTSIADLARVLKLAPSTVSRALSPGAHVREATRQRVQQLAAALQYQPNQLAVALRKGQRQALGVLVPHLTGSFFAQVLDGITKAATKAGYQVIICPSWEDSQQEKKNLELLLNAQVAGLLVSLASNTRDLAPFEAVRAAKLPLVFFDRVVEGLTGDSISSVVVDDYAGAYAAVAHLIAEGCRRIAHLAGLPHLGIYRQRRESYRQALHDHGLSYREELVCRAESGQLAGADGMRQLLALPLPPDAVFAATDSLTAGALRVLKARGLRIPQDVALAGFSNAEFAALTAPALTTVDQCSQQMGGLAVQQVLQILHPPRDGAPPSPVLLSPQLLVRGSSRRAGGLS